MNSVFWGTEEEIEGTYAAALTLSYELNDILFVAHEKRWLEDGKGLMACKSVSVYSRLPTSADTLQNSAVDAGIKMRPTNEELSSMSPEFSHRWSTFFANAPDKPVMLAIPYAGCVHLILIDQELIFVSFLAMVERIQRCLVNNAHSV